MEKVRFGIIGVGNIGTAHAKKLIGGIVENGVLSAICDLKPERIERMKAHEGCPADLVTFTDYKEMLASGTCDAVIVATPHYIHPQLSIDAMRAGLHVLCEKPAGVYTKQVKEMNRVAEESDVLFTMMFNQRTNCIYRKMRELIANGEIGNIKRVNWIITTWYRAQNYFDSGDWRATWRGEGGGVLFNQCPHQLDLLSWITGMMPERVHAFCHFGKWHDIEVEDDVTAYMEFPNGSTGVFITSTADSPGTNRLEVLGDEGKLVAQAEGEGGETVLTFYKLDQNEREFCKTTQKGFGSQPHKQLIEVETDGKNEQHAGILNNFANAILGLEPLFVDGKEGIRGVELMDAMLLSTWLDRTVSLPVDEDLYLAELKKRIATGRVKEGVTNTLMDTEGTY